MGIRPGDRIAYLGKNSALYFELLFGAIAANVVLAPVNWRLAPPEMASLLQDAEAKVLFVGRGFAAIAASLDLPALDRFMAMDEADFDWMQFEEWRDAQSADDPGVPAAPEDTVLQLYTSGTTGLPKGVELTSTNILTLIDCYESHDVMRLSSDDVALVCMPVFHIAGTGVGLCALHRAPRPLVLEEVKVTEIINAITRHQVNWLLLVPAVILMLTQHIESAPTDLGCVRSLVYGASPIAEDVIVRAMRVFPRARFRQVYGSTESTAVATFLAPDLHDPARGKLRSCGRPYPAIGLRVVNANGATCQPARWERSSSKGPAR